MGRRKNSSVREFLENLLHSVAFCCIFLVIVKLGGVSRVIEGMLDGEGRILVHPNFPFVSVSFGAVLCHFVVLEGIGCCSAVCS